MLGMVLEFTEAGIYCPAADIHIDPWRPVARALITHGHSDHARTGHGAYLATSGAAPVIRHRLGDIRLQTVEYGETRRIGGATFSFHPAGHVPGSAQIRVEVGGEVWVVSGDYKTVDDGLSTPFEPVRCHTFITESTFGLPIYSWTPQDVLADELNSWWAETAAVGQARRPRGLRAGKGAAHPVACWTPGKAPS
jgi:putative mRNA 3-end processing factor